MMRRILTALTLGLTLAAGTAQAQSAAAKATVDAAKAQGAVGEQADGFLGVVGGADSSVRAAVAEINAGRTQAYKDIAAKTGVTPEAAGEATGQQLIGRLAPGSYYKPLNGTWTRK